MPQVIRREVEPDVHVGVLVVGAGAAGLTAALSAHEHGAEVLILERDPTPLGLTGMSTGQIPAAGTRFQREAGIDDAPELLARDLVDAAEGQTDAAYARAVAELAGPTVEWLADAIGFRFDVIQDFTYHGHSRHRMHATPNRSGRELHGTLLAACDAAAIDIATSSYAETLFTGDDDRVQAVGIRRPDGAAELIGCDALVLACNGFAGNPELMRRFCPSAADGFFFGHPGNTGEAVLWGEQLGAAMDDLSSFQAHASIAVPHAIQITWATMREGGFQVNLRGERFADESRGYSEHAVDVIAQPENRVWSVFDERIADVARQVDDFRQAEAARAIKRAADVGELAAMTRLPIDALRATFAEVEAAVSAGRPDRFGRRFREGDILRPPYHAVLVAGAVFMTQGGLCVDGDAAVLRKDGSPLPNLFAAGGAARGLSGPSYRGYLSGAGLLTAVTLGRVAGRRAATLAHA